MKLPLPDGLFLVTCLASLKLNKPLEIRVVASTRIEVLGVAGHEHPQPRRVIINYDLLAHHRERLRAVPL